MADYRIHTHPILTVEERPSFTFTWQGQPMEARAGEMISAALFANGVRTFGHHPKDGAPQGIFCANGQCAQCTVIADGLPVKACMTPVRPGMVVEPLVGRPAPPDVHHTPELQPIPTVEVECLIVGGGPAGLSAAIELGKAGVRTLLVDDKHALGGKLILQTHKFFGSMDACYAGTRGIDIAARLEEEVRRFETVQVWLNTTALAVFSDRKVGVLREGRYVIVQPHTMLTAAGAREKALAFKGNTLPGVYGAGAFQTLLNRDRVRPSERLFIVGGGNVGLITGYHALQAGVQVVGLCEALPDCTGYKVHKDKLTRLGVPIYTSHTVVSANGEREVESVTIARIGEHYGQPIPGTEKTFACDTVLVAIGLDPVDELFHKAREFGLPVWAAGDAEEIAEASAAMFTGRIRGLEIARSLGRDVGETPAEWHRTAEILKSRPGAVVTEDIPAVEMGVFPVLHCVQEIPCNPCTSVCAKGCIIVEGDIRALPEYRGEGCTGCARCVAICPGLAITLVDYRKDADFPIVTVPYEFLADTIGVGDAATALGMEGERLGEVEVVGVQTPQFADRAMLVRVRAPRQIARRIAGVRLKEPSPAETAAYYAARAPEDEIICRCERVTVGEVRALIRAGIRDMNHIKGVTRAGMGACGGKTCTNLILRLFREEGVAPEQVVESTRRPLFIEVPLGVFAGMAVGEVPAEEVKPARTGEAHEWGV